jgi:hypothetical protein
LPSTSVYFRRVKRAAWEQDPFVVDDVLPHLYDASVREGNGLSLWLVEGPTDEAAVIAILALGDRIPSNGPLHVLAIPSDLLGELGMRPEHTPDGTASSHTRAKELHHDLFGLDEASARQLCARIGEDPSAFLRTIRARDLGPIMAAEAGAFTLAADVERARRR